LGWTQLGAQPFLLSGQILETKSLGGQILDSKMKNLQKIASCYFLEM
jgi:hypothetical protein